MSSHLLVDSYHLDTYRGIPSWAETENRFSGNDQAFILCVEWRQKPVQSTFKSALVNKAIKTVGEINEPLQENSVYRVNLKYAKDGPSSSQ